MAGAFDGLARWRGNEEVVVVMGRWLWLCCGEDVVVDGVLLLPVMTVVVVEAMVLMPVCPSSWSCLWWLMQSCMDLGVGGGVDSAEHSLDGGSGGISRGVAAAAEPGCHDCVVWIRSPSGSIGGACGGAGARERERETETALQRRCLGGTVVVS